MKTTISTKGRVVLPSPTRRRLGLRAGDPLDAKVEGGRVVLTPSQARLRKVRIIEDPVTGLPVLTAGPDAPCLTSKQVEDILATFS
jgi:AbrB family looped-hinge helix DNA binding protein